MEPHIWAELARIVRDGISSERDRVLARWIDDRYSTEVVAIIRDSTHGAGRTPLERLWVFTRTREQAASFRTSAGNYDPAKQSSIATASGDPSLFVVFDDFESNARDAVVASLGTDAPDRLVAELADPAIWKIMWAVGTVVVFVRTPDEVERIAGTAEWRRWEDRIWEELHPADEFDVLPREAFQARLDSRERYDTQFEGSSFYYFR